MAKKMSKNQTHQDTAKADKSKGTLVNALEFLRTMHIDWVLERSLEPGDIDVLKAKVNAGENGTEWASWWMPYVRVDGNTANGIAWGISAPIGGKFIILRLVEHSQVKATLRVYASGKGILTGVEPVVKALLGRGDIKQWTDEDTAALL